MGIFPSTLPNIDTMMVNMIVSFDYDPKGKQIVDSTSLSMHEEMYKVIPTLSDDHTDDLASGGFGPLPPALLVRTLSSYSGLSLQEFSF